MKPPLFVLDCPERFYLVSLSISSGIDFLCCWAAFGKRNTKIALAEFVTENVISSHPSCARSFTVLSIAAAISFALGA